MDFVTSHFGKMNLWPVEHFFQHNVWRNKNRTKGSSKTLLCLVRFLLHQTLHTYLLLLTSKSAPINWLRILCIIIFSYSILGEPLPSVRWYMDDKLLDETYQQTFEGVVKNDLTIRRLERVHTQSKLRCLASNNNLTRPVETSLQLKMLCK